MLDPLIPVRRLSALQKQILTVLVALEGRRPGPVATRDIERLLADAVGKPVYGGNLRQSCRRLETAGLVHTLRAQNLQLTIALTDAGRDTAAPLLEAERQADAERQRATEVRILPVRPVPATLEDSEVEIDGQVYTACQAAYVVRLDGTTCLQLWATDGRRTQLTGDALQVAAWYQACYDAGLPVRFQVNGG